jgi:branched-chain amino acid transport system permease protein
MLTMGLFVLSGITGQLNMGQAAFWAIGAYSYAIAIGRLGWPFLGAALFAIVITISISLIFGLTALRVSGIYFAMVTLGLGEIVRIVLLNWRKLSGGGMGMRNIPCPAILGTVIKTPAQFYILTLVLVLLCFYVTRRLLTAYVGLSMKGVGSNEVVAKGLGINAFRVKLLALAVSSFFAAMAGVVFSSYYRFLHPDAFTSAQSFFLVQMLVIGGIHSLLGVVAITPLLTFSLEYLRALGEYQMIAYAGLLILFLIFCPQGVGGLVERCLRERNPKHNSLHNSRGSEENI